MHVTVAMFCFDWQEPGPQPPLPGNQHTKCRPEYRQFEYALVFGGAVPEDIGRSLANAPNAKLNGVAARASRNAKDCMFTGSGPSNVVVRLSRIWLESLCRAYIQPSRAQAQMSASGCASQAWHGRRRRTRRDCLIKCAIDKFFCWDGGRRWSWHCCLTALAAV